MTEDSASKTMAKIPIIGKAVLKAIDAPAYNLLSNCGAEAG